VRWTVAATVVAVEGEVTGAAWKKYLNCKKFVVFEALAVAVVEGSLFWNITPCSQIKVQ
jgi:hypothetical protein